MKLALHDAKVAARNKIRSRFHSSSDLIHRLFVCISGKGSSFTPSQQGVFASPGLTFVMCDAGVADQLQTNYASDLRGILKTLFEVMATKCEQGDNDKQKKGKQLLTIVNLYSQSIIYVCVDIRDRNKWPFRTKCIT